MADSKGPVEAPTAKALEEAMAGIQNTYGQLQGEGAYSGAIRQLVWQQLWLEYSLSQQADKLFMLRETVRTLVVALESGSHKVTVEHGIVAKFMELLSKELEEED